MAEAYWEIEREAVIIDDHACGAGGRVLAEARGTVDRIRRLWRPLRLAARLRPSGGRKSQNIIRLYQRRQ
jgi:hypothetical protein